MPIYSLSNAYTFHSDTIILYQQQLQLHMTLYVRAKKKNVYILL